MNKGVIQQVGTPTDIYDNPANTFVASFIGSPAMNLVSGDIDNGTFRGPGITVGGLQTNVRGPVTLGFRAEDASLVSEGGEFGAEVYSMELLGEATMASFRIGDQLVSIKSGKEYRAEIGDVVHAAIPASICHLFDTDTGVRIARTPGN